MRKSEIKVGGHYLAKVSGKVVTVRVDAIREVECWVGLASSGKKAMQPRFDVTNLTTGRKTTFRSAAKFRGIALNEEQAKAKKVIDQINDDLAEMTSGSSLHIEARITPTKEVEQCPDPTDSPRTNSTPNTTSVGEGKVGEDEQGSDPIQSPAEPSVALVHPVMSDYAMSTVTTSCLASKIASTHTAYERGTQVAGYTPTEEQDAILEAVRQPGLTVLVIGAGAGAGKTSQLRMLEVLLPGRGRYTTFSRPLVNEAKTKFKKVKCDTQHGLAFAPVGKLYTHRLGGNRVRSGEVALMLGINSMTVTMPDPSGKLDENDNPIVTTKTLQPSYLAGQVMEAIKKFCQSADREIDRKHFKGISGIDKPGEYTNQNSVRDALVPFARKAWVDISNVNGTMPFTHDCYVKIWQLGEGSLAPVISADYILVDEAQDTAPVFLDVLRRQSCLLIVVGDSNQAIYEWRGAVDAMKAFPGAPRKLLSQSFRFGQTVADVANSILAGLDEPTDLVMRGCDIPSRVILGHDARMRITDGSSGEVVDTSIHVLARTEGTSCRAVLCRTNACAVGTVLAAVRENRRPHLVGGGSDVVSFVKAAESLQQGRGTSHPELCLFKNWAEVQAYVKEDEGSDLKLMVKLIDEFRCRPILEALENMPCEEDADLVVSTAHKSKGREWTSVRLASDFPPSNRMCDADRRLLYVAATRAQHILDLSECTPFLPARDRTTGEEIEPIRIKFTKRMPMSRELDEYMERKAIDYVSGIESKKLAADPHAYDNQSSSPVVVDNTGPVQNGVSSEFTWANFGGGWRVGGPKGHENKTVEVTRKNGTTSTERLGKVAKDLGERCIYNLA